MIGRGKEQFDKENQILQEHLKIESQIRKVEEEEQKKLKLIGQLVGIKIPCVIPCQLIDPKKPIDDYHRERSKAGFENDQVPNLYDKVGLNRNLKNAGVYFISNEIAQEPPLPDDLKLKAKMWKEGLQIDVSTLTPSTKVAQMMDKINEQLMILFQFEGMVDSRKKELKQIQMKEEQQKVLIQAQMYNIKEMHFSHVRKKVEQIKMTQNLNQQFGQNLQYFHNQA